MAGFFFHQFERKDVQTRPNEEQLHENLWSEKILAKINHSGRKVTQEECSCKIWSRFDQQKGIIFSNKVLNKKNWFHCKCVSFCCGDDGLYRSTCFVQSIATIDEECVRASVLTFRVFVARLFYSPQRKLTHSISRLLTNFCFALCNCLCAGSARRYSRSFGGRKLVRCLRAGKCFCRPISGSSLYFVEGCSVQCNGFLRGWKVWSRNRLSTVTDRVFLSCIQSPT